MLIKLMSEFLAAVINGGFQFLLTLNIKKISVKSPILFIEMLNLISMDLIL